MKGIMFTEEMFNAVIDLSKTQTRRTGGLDLINEKPNEWKLIGVGNDGRFAFDYGYTVRELIRPRYLTGETVYIKEPYVHSTTYKKIDYKYNAPELWQKGIKWENKMFMPERHARHFIKITNVRCERLQDISEADAKAEGIEKAIGWKGYKDYCIKNVEFGYISNPILSFETLWVKINGQKSFELNPWLFVYEFELIK